MARLTASGFSRICLRSSIDGSGYTLYHKRRAFPVMNASMRSAWVSFGSVAGAALLAACGGGKPAEAPVAEGKADDTAADAAAPANDTKAAPAADAGGGSEGVPTKCFKSGATCSPDPKFVK